MHDECTLSLLYVYIAWMVEFVEMSSINMVFVKLFVRQVLEGKTARDWFFCWLVCWFNKFVELTPSCLQSDADWCQDPRRGKRGRLYLTLHCHHQNDSALRWVSVWAIIMFHTLSGAKSQRQCPQMTTFEDKEELKQNWTEVHPLTTYQPHTAPQGHPGSPLRYFN